MKEEYDWVTQNFDKVLAEHGYVREGHYYRAEKANEDTLVFFCHFGVSCVLISYLLSISPLVMLQNFCAAPSSVSTIVTEERRKGIASFRMSSFGDISHLYAHQEPPSLLPDSVRPMITKSRDMIKDEKDGCNISGIFRNTTENNGRQDYFGK